MVRVSRTNSSTLAWQARNGIPPLLTARSEPAVHTGQLSSSRLRGTNTGSAGLCFFLLTFLPSSSPRIPRHQKSGHVTLQKLLRRVPVSLKVPTKHITGGTRCGLPSSPSSGLTVSLPLSLCVPVAELHLQPRLRAHARITLSARDNLPAEPLGAASSLFSF